ncbi:MAG: biosynthetic arginine decarboxylase [Gammaproteobacteria bacterium]
MADWTIQQARDIYNIAHWGGGYFDVNDRGNLVAHPDRKRDQHGIDLYELAAQIKTLGLSLPVLVRFSDILHQRVDTLCSSFADAMKEDAYHGHFTAVYPIKVNQQRRVIEEILKHGAGRVGLEAGSKPELMAVLALSHAQTSVKTDSSAKLAQGGIVICNGYKDREYIRLALIGKQLGHRVYIVVERFCELELIIEEARKLNVMPLIGVRVRLASIGAGKWQNTGGEKSKFGLSATQVLRVVEHLRQVQMLDSLQLMHFHLGSQIANIHDIQLGMRECARYYAELWSQGVKINCVDVGGGLGVDYDGTRSRNFCSINYSVQEYANNVVQALYEICVDQNLPHPDIITESGRAMTAHHAMLITNVIDSEQALSKTVIAPAASDEPRIIQDLWRGLDTLSGRSAREAYHDAVHWLSEAQIMFTHGVLSLPQRARAEQIYTAICWKVRDLLQTGTRSQREVVDELNEKLADKYFCNFSLFQSMPDSWAIDQIFPIMPLHRLGEIPTRRATLQDITCDSDGRIDFYVDSEGVETSLRLHPMIYGEPYLLGIFLLGAYQEILGDMHNLFGDTDSIHVEMTPDGGYRLVQPLHGDTVETVLKYVHFNADDLLAAFRSKIESAVLSKEQRDIYFQELSEGLTGYTYLED